MSYIVPVFHKVMLLVALGHPCHDHSQNKAFDGKLGMWPVGNLGLDLAAASISFFDFQQGSNGVGLSRDF